VTACRDLGTSLNSTLASIRSHAAIWVLWQQRDDSSSLRHRGGAALAGEGAGGGGGGGAGGGAPQFCVHFGGLTNLSLIFLRYSGYIVSAPPSVASRGMP